jgi:hypothetical protein
VDCGDDGVANVKVTYGKVVDKELIGRNPTTLANGGQETFDKTYGVSGFDPNQYTLTATTKPTRGTCKTTLTDYELGTIIAERESAGQAVLTAVVQGPGS